MGLLSKVFGKKKEVAEVQNEVEVPKESPKGLRVGDLIVAEPFFSNPTFNQSIVMLIAVEDEQVVGLIVNKPNYKYVKDLKEGTKLQEAVVGLGGPVQTDLRIFMLSSQEIERLPSKEVKQGVWVSDDLGQFETIAQESQLKETSFFAGLVAWKPEQLSDEIKDGMWKTQPNPYSLAELTTPGMWHEFNPGFDFELDVKIFPRIKANKGNEMYKEENADEKAINIPADQQPISSDYTGDLVLCFVKEIGEHYLYLNKQFYNEYSAVTPQLLEKLAVNQLIEEVGERIEIKGSPDDVLMVTAGGNHEASIVLMKDFMDYLQNQVEEELMIAIPAQDLLFVCKKNNAAAIEKMSGFVQQCFSKDDTQGLLSKGLYTRAMGSSRLEFVKQAF